MPSRVEANGPIRLPRVGLLERHDDCKLSDAIGLTPELNCLP